MKTLRESRQLLHMSCLAVSGDCPTSLRMVLQWHKLEASDWVTEANCLYLALCGALHETAIASLGRP